MGLDLKTPDQPLKVCVIGLGYIGLPTASILAMHGHTVHGVDVSPSIVETINQGKIHIHEPNLDQLVQEVVTKGRLRASLKPCPADVFVICVPTPINQDKSPNVAYVQAATKAIEPYVRAGNLVILESTSPPRTTEDIVASQMVSAGFTIGKDVFVAYCPERVLPGRILIEVIENDRIVGGVTPRCAEQVKGFYETFVKGTVFSTTAITAEITKLAENAYRDVNIAFANELSMFADELGADPFDIIQLANRHPRVNILNPGPGVGGHCISVDPWFLVHAAPHQSALIHAARLVNHAKPLHVVSKVLALSKRTKSKVIGCLGLTYKPDVDDLRESPSIEVVNLLNEARQAEVLACDPFVESSSVNGVPLVSQETLLKRSDILVLLTAHQQFRNVSPDLLLGKHVVDTCGAWRDKIAAPNKGLAEEAPKPVAAQRRAA